MPDPAPDSAIVEAILAKTDTAELYRTSGEFRWSLDLLALNMLPAMVAGIAAQARLNEDTQRLLRQAMATIQPIDPEALQALLAPPTTTQETDHG